MHVRGGEDVEDAQRGEGQGSRADERDVSGGGGGYEEGRQGAAFDAGEIDVVLVVGEGSEKLLGLGWIC